MEAMAGMIAVVLYLIVVFMMFSTVYAPLFGYLIAVYILEGKSLSAIARRRGIEKPWLAWVPVGNSWLLGAVSDQYRYVVHGQVRNRRKLLPWLSGALYLAMGVLFTVLGIWMVTSIVLGVNSSEETFMATYMGGFFLVYLLMFAFYGVLAVTSVFQHMAYFDLFRSCDPDKSLVYLLVSIFAGYPLPFFVFSCRNKDLGMPPRTDASCE